MDKLKPILAQKFWIFFGIVLILPLAGYFMTKGELAAQISSRWEGLNKTFNEIPAGTDSPNEEWSKGLQALNEKQALHIRLAQEALWRAQKAKMRWPDDITAVMNKAEYFMPVSPENGGSDAQFKYKYDYPRELRRLWEIVDPLDDGKNLRDSDKRRKVAFAMSDLYQTNMGRWKDFPPTFPDIWACQEDIWLQTELLQAIARLNASSISQGDAFIKQLGPILLFGGSKATGTATAASAPTDMPAAGSDLGMFGGPTMGGGNRRNEFAPASAEINLAEEFNVWNDPNVLSGRGGAGGMSAGGMPDGGMYSESTAAAPTTGGAAGAASESKRYLDEVAAQPYKRRGFYIKVVMDHTKVPEFIAELMNSPFPVEIVRVRQVWLSDSAASPAGTGGSPFLAGGRTPFGGFNSADATDNAATFGTTDSTGGEYSVAGDGNSIRQGLTGSGSQAAMSDPNLAQVSILGIWTLYRPPVAGAAQPVPGTATPNPDVATTPATATEATTGSATSASEPVASEATASEPKSSEPGDVPNAEPAKPEKKEPETDPDKTTDEVK